MESPCIRNLNRSSSIRFPERLRTSYISLFHYQVASVTDHFGEVGSLSKLHPEHLLLVFCVGALSVFNAQICEIGEELGNSFEVQVGAHPSELEGENPGTDQSNCLEDEFILMRVFEVLTKPFYTFIFYNMDWRYLSR